MSIKRLQKILDEIDMPVMMEVIECVWYKTPYEIKWNTDDCKEDLSNGDNNSYSIEFYGTTVYQGYLVVNGDTGCGETVTYFFNLSKEVKF